MPALRYIYEPTPKSLAHSPPRRTSHRHSDILNSIHLPTYWPRQVVQSFQAAQYTFQLSETLAEAVKALSQQDGMALFMTMLTAFQILLYRYIGQEDLLFGAIDLGHARAADQFSQNSSNNPLVLRTKYNHAKISEMR